MKNKPAFPTSALDAVGGKIFQEGMTLREYYAGLAMQGIYSSQANMEKIFKYHQGYSSGILPAIAEQAVRQADALIAELEKGKGE